MGSFDFLFMPSNHEGLVLTSIEASLAHAPAVVNWCPGVNETLSEEWPLKVHDNNVEDFIDLFKNKLLSCDYEQLTEKAYKYVRGKFSIKTMRKGYEKKYLEINEKFS